MKRKRIPQSLRKHIRLEKARIRREFSDIKNQKELISGLYQKLYQKNDNKRNLQSSHK